MGGDEADNLTNLGGEAGATNEGLQKLGGLDEGVVCDHEDVDKVGAWRVRVRNPFWQ